MSSPRAVVFHGYTASPHVHWFDWLVATLGEEGIRVDVPELPDSHHPRPAPWGAAARAAIGEPDDSLVVVGHSLGCITALSTLETFAGEWSLGGIVLVSAFDEPVATLPELDEFTTALPDYARLTGRIARRTVVASDNDTIVAPQHSRDVADRLGAAFHEVKDGGHFLGTEFALVADEIRAALSPAAIL